MGAEKMADIKDMLSVIARHNFKPAKQNKSTGVIISVVMLFIVSLIVACWGVITATNATRETIIVHFDNRTLNAPDGWSIFCEELTSIQFVRGSSIVRINIIEIASADDLVQKTADVFRVIAQGHEPTWTQSVYKEINGKQWVYFEGDYPPEHCCTYTLYEPKRSYQILCISKPEQVMEDQQDIHKFPAIAYSN